MLPLRHYDDDNNLLVRDGLILAFFCKQAMYKIVPGIRNAFDSWIQFIPKDILKWALIGPNAEVYKPVNNRSIGRCYDQLDAQKAKKRELFAFRIQGRDKYNPGFCFVTEGSNKVEDSDSETNLIEIRISTEYFREIGVEAFIKFAVKISEFLPYDSGYASLALNYGPEPKVWDAGEIIGPLALRYPGFDVNSNDWTISTIGSLCRGAQWITFLGPNLTKRLGGETSLAKKIDSGVEIIKAGNGIALRAGIEPEIGDLNRKKDLPLLKSVARAIEKVTYFNDSSLIELFNEDEDKLERWERRFLD